MNRPTPSSPPWDVLIIGGSARSAAQSAVRAGWRPWAVDFFGDEDMCESAFRSRTLENYRELPKRLQEWPMMPWIAAGGLENHPKCIQQISEGRTFWGSSVDAIQKVRNPRRLFDALKAHGLPALRIWPDRTPPPADGHWMLKPRRSAGGQGVFVWDQNTVRSAAASSTLNTPHFFQERADGIAVSALFLSDRKRITHIGNSRLLTAKTPFTQFAYGGAIGPVRLSAIVENRIRENGKAIGREFGLRGLWGVDFIQDGSRVWVTEVNPRYTATVELYEHAYQTPLLPTQRQACEEWKEHDGDNSVEVVDLERGESRHSHCVGKRVMYAERELRIPDWKQWTTTRDKCISSMPVLADRPRLGSVISRGHPICSLFAAGMSDEDCETRLDQRERELRTHLHETAIPMERP